MDRKRTISFKICLPCRPLAEWQASLTTSSRRTPPEARHEARPRRRAPPLPLGGEGWGGGLLAFRALGHFLHQQQRQVLPELGGDFLPRLVVVLDGHAFLLRIYGISIPQR